MVGVVYTLSVGDGDSEELEYCVEQKEWRAPQNVQIPPKAKEWVALHGKRLQGTQMGRRVLQTWMTLHSTAPWVKIPTIPSTLLRKASWRSYRKSSGTSSGTRCSLRRC